MIDKKNDLSNIDNNFDNINKRKNIIKKNEIKFILKIESQI